jgi:predicted permease
MTGSVGTLWSELKVSGRALSRAKGLSIAVVLTLALGIGANSAMFTLLRGVLLRPLVNRDEDRLIYIRQTSSGTNANFSIPEIGDLRARSKTFSAFGEFSTFGFTMTGLGEPRTVRAGVAAGPYFQVMGLRPVLGRLLNERDDGPNASGAVVLTYRFWSSTLNRDPSVIGKTIRLDSLFDARRATIVGVLEPCVPYPQDTEIIANVVSSAHHLSATMVTNRIHRMTELFARLAPGADLEQARAELYAEYGAIKRAHPEAYPDKAGFQISAVRLRDQLTSGARTILLVLMAASVLVFVIACSNVANLILARTIRREGELVIRAALGAGTWALRRVLLIESLLLCTGGAILGALISSPLLSILARYISRYSVRALELQVDSSILWVGAGLALFAAILLAFVPRLPTWSGSQRFGQASLAARVTGTANRKLKVFAVVQIAASFILMSAAAVTVNTLLYLQSAQSGFDTHHVLSVDVPVVHNGRTPSQVVAYEHEMVRRIRELPGVVNVSVAAAAPWRDAADYGSMQFAPDGHPATAGEESPEASLRIVSPGFFGTLGLPMIEGRDFTDADGSSSERVAVVSMSLAERIFKGDALNHHLIWTDPILQAVPLVSTEPLRIIGIVADVDDVNIVSKPMMTIYRPFAQEAALGAGHLFIHASSNPENLAAPVTRILRQMSADQPVEHVATLAGIRAEVLSPNRLNAMVSGIFAGVALLIAVVGVAGVLAFSVSARTREFGIRMAMGSQPRHLLMRVVAEGGAMAIIGMIVGLTSGSWLAQLAEGFLGNLQSPGALPVAAAALVLLLAAVTASAVPAARAARVDVMQALRTE